MVHYYHQIFSSKNRNRYCIFTTTRRRFESLLFSCKLERRLATRKRVRSRGQRFISIIIRWIRRFEFFPDARNPKPASFRHFAAGPDARRSVSQYHYYFLFATRTAPPPIDALSKRILRSTYTYTARMYTSSLLTSP